MSRESFMWGLFGSLIILFVTTIFSYAGWANRFFQDEDILFFLQATSLLAAAIAAVGLIVTRRPPAAR
jgi:hypothetical protein